MSISATMLSAGRWDFLPDGHDKIKPLRTAIIGCGPRAWYNGIPKLTAYADFELLALCDIRASLVERTAAAAKSKYESTLHTYTDYREMIRRQPLDAVMVLADADKQASIICDCLEAGLHVMSEVPLCYTLEDCWRIVTTVERTGRVFLLMEQIRYGGYVQAWRNIVRSGVLGDIVLAEGEYFHNLPLRMYQDDDGVYYTAQCAQRSGATPTWRLRHPPIVYLPHDLSPVLSVLDDRVTRVMGMESNRPTATTPGQDYPSLQMALMHTQKDSVLRMGVSFNTAAPERHWQHIKGTRGYVEMPRVADGSYLMWVDQWQLPAPLKMPWGLSRMDAPAAAVGSGHGDCDYYVFAAFADAVLRGVALEFDVYRAAEITAPAILAADSIRQGGVSLEVPDFRPGPQRKVGVMPREQ